MAKKLDKIVVVDIEATCWETKVPEGMFNDIIEIGICLLNIHTGDISESRGILVIPERSELSDFCKSLTGITAEMISKEGIGFKAACKMIEKEYETKSRARASFGGYDLRQFQKQCTATGVAYPSARLT